MLKEGRLSVLGYGGAIGAVAVATALTLFAAPFIGQNFSPLFFLVVILSAWYGGLGPGLLATLSSTLAIDYFFISPTFALKLSQGYPLRLSVFAMVALLISSLTAARKRAEEELRKTHDELEKRVEERTAELATANEILRAEITERKETENRLAQVTRELVERNEELLRLQAEVGRVERLAALGKITGTIAHELGTPLNSVLGYTQLLAQDNLPESARRRTKIVEAQIQRMVDIINNYLFRARGYARRHYPVHVDQLVVETLEMLKPIFQQRKVEVQTVLPDSLPAIKGDGVSLQRVLINLLDNAVDAIEDGGSITVSARWEAEAVQKQPGIIIEVADTGVGIAPELLPRIFEFFVTTKAPGQGTGLGLAVCQEIIKGHGGTIKISSHFGNGTCARICLPIHEEVTQPARMGNEG